MVGYSVLQLDLKKLSLPKDPKSMTEWVREFGVGMRPMDDPFFAEGDKLCGMYRREGIIDIDDETLCHQVMKTFLCEILNCKMEFDNILSYELHYNSQHRYTCSECKKQLPSPHLLDLHISETHDSFFMALAERKPMYRCFVENCSALHKDAKERRSHCIEDHKYPHDFKFDHCNKKVQQRKKSGKAKAAQNGKAKTAQDGKAKTAQDGKAKTAQDESMEGEAKDVKSTYHGPFSFGHKKMGKTFNTSKGKKEKPIEMHELMESLPS